MLSAILILLAMPTLDVSRLRSNQFRPLAKVAFWFFVFNFLILMFCGAQHVESPFIELGQFATVFYFSYFLVFVPIISMIENTFFDIATEFYA